MSNPLLEEVQNTINFRKEGIEEAKRQLTKAQLLLTIVRALPPHILEYTECSVSSSLYQDGKELDISYFLPSDLDADGKAVKLGELMSMWKKQGVDWQDKAMHSYGSNFSLKGLLNLESPNSHEMSALRKLGITELEVWIHNLDKPPTCRLIKHVATEIKEVETVTYEVICDDKAEVEE